jgi:hypothetical protein
MGPFLLLNIFLCLLSLQGQVLGQDGASCTSRYGNVQTGICRKVEDCTGAPLAGSCQNSFVCCIDDTVKPPIVREDSLLTSTRFLNLVGKSRRNFAMYSYFVDAMNYADIATDEYNSVYKRSAFLSQLVDESDYFRRFESNKIDKDNDPVLGMVYIKSGNLY